MTETPKEGASHGTVIKPCRTRVRNLVFVGKSSLQSGFGLDSQGRCFHLHIVSQEQHSRPSQRLHSTSERKIDPGNAVVLLKDGDLDTGPMAQLLTVRIGRLPGGDAASSSKLQRRTGSFHLDFPGPSFVAMHHAVDDNFFFSLSKDLFGFGTGREDGMRRRRARQLEAQRVFDLVPFHPMCVGPWGDPCTDKIAQIEGRWPG